MNVRPGRDVTEIVGTFLTVAEAVVAHWVEYSKGLLLFVMLPGHDRSGEGSTAKSGRSSLKG
jgi:hypothetical protein